MKKVLTLLLGVLFALSFVMASDIQAARVAPSQADLSGGDGCYSDAPMSDWGVATNDGTYGGVDEADFCLVWDVGCEDNDYATVDLYFPAGPQVITIKHLDGLSNLDSFNVLVDGQVVGTYTDSLDSTEVWVESSFNVNVGSGTHTIKIELIDNEWDSCGTWGQLAVDYINVTQKTNEVPEFGIFAAFGMLALAGLFIHQRRK